MLADEQKTESRPVQLRVGRDEGSGELRITGEWPQKDLPSTRLCLVLLASAHMM